MIQSNLTVSCSLLLATLTGWCQNEVAERYNLFLPKWSNVSIDAAERTFVAHVKCFSFSVAHIFIDFNKFWYLV